MDTILHWYKELSPTLRSFLRVFLSFSLFYCGIFAEHYVTKDIDTLTMGPLALRAISMGLAGLILFGISATFSSRLDSLFDRDRRQQEHLAYASSLISQYIASQTKTVAAANETPTPSKDSLLHLLVTSKPRIQEITDKVYQFFESKYGQSSKIEEKIDFEVTFMSKSYIDQGITIPAYANRMGRAPKSMIDRQGHPERYNQSVTAEVYRDGRPEMRLISDTSDPKAGYVALYSGQTERIKSTIIQPVLSFDNRILGTLVVHCDQKGFFKNDDGKFWREIFEGFARNLALEKTRLDALMSTSVATTLGFSPAPPF
ncbi:GAF domain-containing protein [Corallococcus exiguus]|uniref:GAF domain-containing protein n=1 Tax=Corallococcus exiguus TaxID=83462 RepID=UPI003DA6C5AE